MLEIDQASGRPSSPFGEPHTEPAERQVGKALAVNRAVDRGLCAVCELSFRPAFKHALGIQPVDNDPVPFEKEQRPRLKLRPLVFISWILATAIFTLAVGEMEAAAFGQLGCAKQIRSSGKLNIELPDANGLSGTAAESSVRPSPLRPRSNALVAAGNTVAHAHKDDQRRQDGQDPH